MISKFTCTISTLKPNSLFLRNISHTISHGEECRSLRTIGCQQEYKQGFGKKESCANFVCGWRVHLHTWRINVDSKSGTYLDKKSPSYFSSDFESIMKTDKNALESLASTLEWLCNNQKVSNGLFWSNFVRKPTWAQYVWKISPYFQERFQTNINELEGIL